MATEGLQGREAGTNALPLRLMPDAAGAGHGERQEGGRSGSDCVSPTMRWATDPNRQAKKRPHESGPGCVQKARQLIPGHHASLHEGSRRPRQSRQAIS